MTQRQAPMPSQSPTNTELYTPKLVTVFREGYSLAHLRADAVAGLTVAIVALPLSMTIAIASGATPAQGLYTAIVGGFLVSLFSGSRFQIGGLAGATIVIVQGVKRLWPNRPGMLIAVAGAAAAVALLDLHVATIGSRFGGIPNTFPLPSLPPLSLEKIQAVLPSALAFTLLGSIESLLSAVVADGMTGRRHRSNCELVGQGIANVGSALFGGICVTGTIARTAQSPACCTRCFCCCSCSWPRRSPRTFRWRALPACSRSSPGTWPRSTPSRP